MPAPSPFWGTHEIMLFMGCSYSMANGIMHGFEQRGEMIRHSGKYRKVRLKVFLNWLAEHDGVRMTEKEALTTMKMLLEIEEQEAFEKQVEGAANVEAV